jgi:flagellar biosynthesis protein FlhF
MMRIKKFTGPNIAKSLALAKAEMGDDALILQTMRRRKGAASEVEIVAANNRALRSAASLRAPGSDPGARRGGRPEAGTAQPETRAGALRVPDLSVMRELEQVGLQLDSVMSRIAPPEWDDRRKQLTELRVNLQNAGFDPGLVQRTFLKREPVPGGSFEMYLRDLVRDVPLEAPEEKVSVFVGPSGSGKTTALLKVAAAVLLSRGVTPRILFFGPGRAGDAKGLAQSCREMGVKFKAVTDGLRLAKEIEKCGEHPVLIDTPGITGLKDEDLGIIAGLTGSMEGAVIRLVVNSAMDPVNISAIASCIPEPARVTLVLTKFDEATRIGGAISAAIREGIPVAYVTGGREFESGIFVPDRMLLYDRIVEGLADTGTGGN